MGDIGRGARAVVQGSVGGGSLVESDERLRRRIEAQALDRSCDFERYCLRYRILGYPLPTCKLRVFCFHGAGSTESNYTAPDTPFLMWAKAAKDVEICAL